MISISVRSGLQVIFGEKQDFILDICSLPFQGESNQQRIEQADKRTKQFLRNKWGAGMRIPQLYSLGPLEMEGHLSQLKDVKLFGQAFVLPSSQFHRFIPSDS